VTHIVGIGGTTRAGSSSENAMRFTLAHAESLGASTVIFAADKLIALPHYAPEDPARVPEATELVEQLRKANGVIVASPGYHGSVSGLVKNALDYTEDMRDDDPRPYFSGRAVGLIVTAYGWQATVTTLQSLRSIVHALRGWPTPLGAAINSTAKVFNDEGDVVDERARFQLETVAAETVAGARALSA